MSSAPVLGFEGVSKAFGRGDQKEPVFADAWFVVEDGGFLGVHGSRRAGKSTLLRLAAGIEVPDEGVVRFCGQDLSRLSVSGRTRLRRDAIGFVPGAFSVDGAVAASSRCEAVVEHVSLPLVGAGSSPAAAEFAADRVLDRVGASSYADAGLQELAPVQRARVALARALVRGPRLLLVDDPAPTEDIDERHEIAELLERLASDTALTVVVASTDLDVLRAASVVATLADGTVRAVARPGMLVPFPRWTPEGSAAP